MIEYIRIAVCFAAGIYLSERVSVFFSVLFILSLILVLTIKTIFKHKFGIKILIAAAAFFVGVAACSFASSSERHDLDSYAGRYVTITGRISEHEEKNGDNWRYTISAAEVLYKEESKKINDKLIVTSPSAYIYGETVTVSGFIDYIPERMNENSFDIAQYYRTRGIFYKMYANEIKSASYSINDYSPYALGMYFKKYISNQIDKHYSGDYAAIMKAVLTGNKKEFSDDFDSVLDRTGLRRFYYPAFIHIMLFMSLIALILSFTGRKQRDYITVIIMIAYSLFVIDNSVMLRLCIMLVVLILYRRFYGYIYYPDIIGITVFVIGIINPLIFFDAGFVMSLLSSVLVHYFYDTVSSRLGFIKIRYINRLVSISIICSVGLIPVSAYFFGTVSLHSVLVSFIMLPCVTVIMILSPLLIALYAVFNAAPVLDWAVKSMLFVLKNIPLLADKLRFLSGDVPSEGTIGLLIYMFVMVAAVKFTKHKKNHAVAALIAATALFAGHAVYEFERSTKLDITFVNVGQGDGAVINAPYRYSILIDGGGGNAYSDYNPGEKLFLEYLRAEGIKKIDSAFVSHYHKDHVQGIVAAIENLRVRNVFMPDNMEGSEWREAIEKAANENNTEIHYINEETLLTYNNGMTVRIIPPAQKTTVSEDENDTSYLYYITYGDFSAMFTGDMTQFAEKNLLTGKKVGKADLLKVAHHGSRTSSCAEWIQTVDPRYSVISVGENNTYYLPHRETLENLKGTLLYRTDRDGDVRFSVSKNGQCEIQTFDRRK